jgi:pyruvate-ferredoxin/flavodoxin oxidoreductase
MLRSIARVGENAPSRSDIEADVRREISGRLAAAIMQLATGEAVAGLSQAVAEESLGSAARDNDSPPAKGDYMAPWIDSAQCTACDECIKLNANIFEYDDNKKAHIKDPDGGPYQDLVKAAERCTAQVIHPGLPKDRSAKDIDKWIARAEKFN